MPPSSKAQSDKFKAAQVYEEFTGHDAHEGDWVKLPEHEAYAEVGLIDAVQYTTVRDGVTEHYIHEFKDKARPLFLVAPDGREIRLLADGKWQFTERGIVDN